MNVTNAPTANWANDRSANIDAAFLDIWSPPTTTRPPGRHSTASDRRPHCSPPPCNFHPFLRLPSLWIERGENARRGVARARLGDEMTSNVLWHFLSLLFFLLLYLWWQSFFFTAIKDYDEAHLYIDGKQMHLPSYIVSLKHNLCILPRVLATSFFFKSLLIIDRFLVYCGCNVPCGTFDRFTTDSLKSINCWWKIISNK